ncbi:MAG: DedA family protein [Planctomycetes bacterium]|nr:DedA family protein [Planctomycetota bacterium]
MLRRLYDWVLHWADTPQGEPALAALSFAESSFFPVPPDVLQIALTLGRPARWARHAAISTVASVLGGLAGYALGHGLWQALETPFYLYVPGFTPERFGLVRDYYGRYDAWVVFIAAFTPIPYKVFTIAGGVCRIDLGAFLVASAVGRGARFFLVGAVLRRWGAPARAFIERHFNWLTVAFVVLLLGGFLVLRWLAP